MVDVPLDVYLRQSELQRLLDLSPDVLLDLAALKALTLSLRERVIRNDGLVVLGHDVPDAAASLLTHMGRHGGGHWLILVAYTSASLNSRLSCSMPSSEIPSEDDPNWR